MTKINTTPNGYPFIAQSRPRLDSHHRRLFITDVSKESLSAIVVSLAKNTLQWKESTLESPTLKDLCDQVVAKNEMAASELDQLAEYHYVLHCLTH